MSNRQSLGMLDSKDEVAVFVCDMQEKFKDHIQYFDDIVKVTDRIVSITTRILTIK